MTLARWFESEVWYGRSPWALPLVPLSWLYHLAIITRRQAYLSGLLPIVRLPVPVIVVGNLTVGGTGKTPLVIGLAGLLREHGYTPGILCRGYRGVASRWPQQVRPDSDPAVVGDEAVLLARRTHCAVAAGPDRVEAGTALLEHRPCDVLICDDGLQHHALARDVEIVVIDGVRRFGNHRLLPAGPLREPLARLQTADLIVANGIGARGEFPMRIIPGPLVGVADDSARRPLADFAHKDVHAVAGIGNPENFFALLRAQGLRVHKHPFPDHHRYNAGELRFDDDLPVIMTEKDAVKCRRIAGAGQWYLPVTAALPEVFEHRLLALIRRNADGQATA